MRDEGGQGVVSSVGQVNSFFPASVPVPSGEQESQVRFSFGKRRSRSVLL